MNLNDFDDLNKLPIKKIDVEDRITINESGNLEEVRYYNIFVVPEKTVEHITVKFNIVPDGLNFDNDGDKEVY